MLHLSNKGSKKSYAAKAACLTAGLVAVFASSSVLAGPAARLRCTISPAQDVTLPVGEGYKVQVISSGVFRITSSTGELVRASMLTQCSHNNQTVQPWSSGDNIYFTVADGARIEQTFDFEAIN